jgi:beta-lactamase regulating signal transducer with metallopeptidase domain
VIFALEVVAMDTFLMQLTELFYWTARASAYAVVVIVIIILAQALLHRRLSAGWTSALWLILLVRLALPFGLSSDLSLWNVLPQKAYYANRGSSGADGGTAVLPVVEKQMPDTRGTAVLPTQTQSISRFPWESLPFIWLGGTLIILGGLIIKNLRLWLPVRKLRQSTHQPLLELLEECKEAMRVRTIVGLVLTDRVQAPALFGFLRPRILLPERLPERIPPEELRCVLMHELAHLKRGDIWLGWLVAILQSLHWFNPLIWWAFARMRADREAAADALALQRMQSGDSDRYADTIVNLLESFTQFPRLPVIAGVVENKTQIIRRLTMITRFKPPRRIDTLVAAVLMAILAVATLTDAQDSTVPARERNVVLSVPWTPAYVRADKFRVGASDQASRLVYKTEPVYPENAKAAGIAGETEFEVTVDEEGNVIDIWSVEGNPLLANAAADAIWLWRYSPLLLNNSPTSVSFPVIIAFLPDGSVATSFELKTNPPQNQFLNYVIPSIFSDDESQDSRILTLANTGFRTFEGRQYLLIGYGMTAPVVDIDKRELRYLADEGWPAEYDESFGRITPLVVRVFINKDGGIDGIAQEYGPKIPAIDDLLLLHTRVLSPAMFGAETVPSHLRIEISPPQSIIEQELQFVSPVEIPEWWPANQ